MAWITILPVVAGARRAGDSGWDAFYAAGFVYYGALLGLILGIYLESRRRNKSPIDYTDTYFRLLPFGQAIGRIGCYFNGCCYGCESHSWMAVPYRIGQVETKILPVPFLESAFCLALGVVLLRWNTSRKGNYTIAYLISYAVFRLIIEFFRGDEIRGIWMGFSTSQWISLIILCVCALYHVQLLFVPVFSF